MCGSAEVLPESPAQIDPESEIGQEVLRLRGLYLSLRFPDFLLMVAAEMVRTRCIANQAVQRAAEVRS